MSQETFLRLRAAFRQEPPPAWEPRTGPDADLLLIDEASEHLATASGTTPTQARRSMGEVFEAMHAGAELSAQFEEASRRLRAHPHRPHHRRHPPHLDPLHSREHPVSTPTHRVLADVRVRVAHPDPRPADGTGHTEWADAVREERNYQAHVTAHGHQPTWADHLRLGAAQALAATDATTLRRELLDLSGLLVGWVEDLDTRSNLPRS